MDIEGVRRFHQIAFIPHCCRQDFDVVCSTPRVSSKGGSSRTLGELSANSSQNERHPPILRPLHRGAARLLCIVDGLDQFALVHLTSSRNIKRFGLAI